MLVYHSKGFLHFAMSDKSTQSDMPSDKELPNTGSGLGGEHGLAFMFFLCFEQFLVHCYSQEVQFLNSRHSMGTYFPALGFPTNRGPFQCFYNHSSTNVAR